MNEKINTVLMQVFDISQEDVIQDLTRDEVSKWDSLTHMDLVVSLETEFNIYLETDDIIAMSSLHAIRDILKKKRVE